MSMTSDVRVPGKSVATFSGRIEPTPVSVAYRLALTVVAIAMLLLPLAYLGLIAVVGSLVWWHVTANSWIASGSSAAFVRLVAYAGPAIAGAVFVFFMVKPILARPVKRSEPIVLLRHDEPVLFEFIDQICDQVRAPVPDRVQVDCAVNASAALAGGMRFIRRRRLALTIGLPLAAGLTVRQLGGVIAHEFGHFAQAGGMLLTSMVRGINAWFARVVYERDDWDVRLERWSREEDWRVAIVLLLARACIWCSRKALAGLMLTGHGISCFMLRQMEFDADSYEIKLAGTAAFVETSVRMRELHVGARFGYDDVRDGWLRRTLPSNLPVFLVDRLGRVPEEVLRQVRNAPAATTGFFDSHPSDADRVRAAERAAQPGIMAHGDAPASVLFRDFEALSAAATRHHYEHDLGLGLDGITFVAASEAAADSRTREAAFHALHKFFDDRLSSFRPLTLAPEKVDALSPTELEDALRTARGEMAAADSGLSGKYRQFETLEHRRDVLFCAEELIAAGFDKVDPVEFELSKGTLDDVQAAAARALDERQQLVDELASFETAAARRLSCAIRLLGRSAGAGAVRAMEAETLVRTLETIVGVWDAVQDCRRLALALETLAHSRNLTDRPEHVDSQIQLLSMRLGRRLGEMVTGPGDAPRQQGVSQNVAGVATVLGLPHGSSVRPIELAERAERMYFRTLGGLAEIALVVEARLDVLRPSAN